jgi:hypothetical protein
VRSSLPRVAGCSSDAFLSVGAEAETWVRAGSDDRSSSHTGYERKLSWNRIAGGMSGIGGMSCRKGFIRQLLKSSSKTDPEALGL